MFSDNNQTKGDGSQIHSTDKSQDNKAPKNSAGGALSILVVEDDQFLRELITNKLKNEGFVINIALDGEDALRKISEEKPDLVLLDIVMPNIDGFEVLRRIREDPKISGIPVIILSNLGQQEDVDRALELGAKDYIIKAHFSPSEIVDKIRKIMQNK